MADITGNDLPYGHLGHAVYDPDEQVWTFQRAPGAGVNLRALGDTRLVVQPVEDAEAFPSPHIKPLITSERHKKEIQDLFKRFPEVQLAAEILPPLLRVSEAVISATGRHDPLKGYLLGIGSIPSEVSHHTIVIAAYPSGSTGSDLQLAQVQLQKRGWDDTKDAWIGVPTFQGEGAIWKGEGAAIQQIVFGHAIEGSDAVLAARMLTRTLIFRPNVRSRGLPALKVAANPCFEVSIASTGRIPHADIAFNPWFTRQFGIVDQAGRWSVWELEGRLTISGRLLNYSLEQDSTSRPAKPVDDGWARIAWVCSPTVVAVCTRRQLDMFNGIGSDVKQPPDVLSLQSPDTSWHLAMVQVPSHPAHLAVLTSTHLTLYHVKEGRRDSIEAKTVLRMRHYRNSEDTTLSLAAFALKDWTLIALHSRVEPVINLYRLRVAEDGGVHVSMPAVLALPSSIAGLGDVPSIAGMHLANTSFGSRGLQSKRNTASLNHDRGVSFVSLTLLTKDLALHEVLYVSTPARTPYSDVAPPTWEAKIAAKAPTKPKKGFVVDDDDDDEVEDGSSDGNVASRAPISSYQQRRLSIAPDRTSTQWTVNLELAARAVLDNAGQETVTMHDVMDSAVGYLRDSNTAGGVSWLTLHDLVEGDISPLDIETCAAELARLKGVESAPHEALQDDAADSQSAAALTMRTLGSEHSGTLTDLHSDMVGAWIMPLSPEVPKAVRLAKEHLVRQAAIEVALASRVLGTEANESDTQPTTQQNQQTQNLPVRAGPSSIHQPGSSSQATFQLPTLPTPFPSATPSVTITSSYSTTLAAPELARLKRYISFSRPIAPSTLPHSLANVLAHWLPGSDTAAYDWRTTSRRLGEQDVEADEQMTEADRARAQRRAARHLRRQRREAVASEAATMAGSQALEIVRVGQPLGLQGVRGGSQREVGGREGSSQGLGVGDVGTGAASQVVPGRFGGRPPARKKRKQGF
ncbi:hypothetical protein LTR35_002584 [Friedmanniomyces endolithicus]|uniref:RNA polymerase I-specific transcription initiation factor RRN6-like protein n=1 Tax=Friedmanniomyces endolithicus TaxID=329885 RepID=A0AAN6JBA9_9PEZI|nr:hypothetical protein LTR35_002584 [Friedmanniomyces endolithicus]KAK0291435.1 hypothetical protein LTS00_008435 [Friedmanniomyces endolithicus]KAK0323535.1 hypothetical protein LTR82_005282 [Friedmanniomyces endolithicus]KAK1019910.1 hypothetical protein LTR54_000554 [Friedmanniomyces endolithicus]